MFFDRDLHSQCAMSLQGTEGLTGSNVLSRIQPAVFSAVSVFSSDLLKPISLIHELQFVVSTQDVECWQCSGGARAVIFQKWTQL